MSVMRTSWKHGDTPRKARNPLAHKSDGCFGQPLRRVDGAAKVTGQAHAQRRFAPITMPWSP